MRFPSEEYCLFMESTNSQQSSTLGSSYFDEEKYTEYYLAYKEAGDRLISVALEDQSLFKEIAIYPIAFLYRQYVELSIKNLLLKISQDFKNDKSIRGSHDLYHLWHILLDIIKKDKLSKPNVFTTEYITNALIGADAYLAELSLVDRESMAFRYPDDKSHTKSYFPNEASIDLINLKERITELANLLVYIEKSYDESDLK